MKNDMKMLNISSVESPLYAIICRIPTNKQSQ